MNVEMPSAYRVSREVSRALAQQLPVVALESTVITHGLPFPDNVTLAENMEHTIREEGCIPAVIAVLDGVIQVGLQPEQIERLGGPERMMKISLRDFGAALAGERSGGTTVAGTMLAASTTGIRVFATGGIGGVHHDLSENHRGSFDISADLPMLARTPMIVVCAGAKAILDLEATLEYLETSGVPVVGYQTDDFPGFYTRNVGLKTSARADTPEEVIQIALSHWELGMSSAVLVTVPPPQEVALEPEQVRDQIYQALVEARGRNLRGPEVTPFLLNRVSELTGGASLRTNLGLLVNNARVAAQIGRALSRVERGLPPEP